VEGRQENEAFESAPRQQRSSWTEGTNGLRHWGEQKLPDCTTSPHPHACTEAFAILVGAEHAELTQSAPDRKNPSGQATFR